jgi:thiamine biosynthesis lipoprotein
LSQETGDGFVRRAKPLLGTLVEIAVPAGDYDAHESGFEAVAAIHRLMSFHEPGSDLARLRNCMAGQTARVSAHTVTVLRAALDLHTLSGGIFDATVGRELVRAGFLPRDDVIHLTRFPGRMEDIEILDDRHVRLGRRMLIDLGGIAKGYAVDRAVDALIGLGVPSGIVNAGGDLRLFGQADQPIMLRNGPGELIDAGEFTDCAIATSSNLHSRRHRRGETATPHIGPSGRPVRIDGLVSVMASSCMIADAMTKVAMVDVERANALLELHQGRVLHADLMGHPVRA